MAEDSSGTPRVGLLARLFSSAKPDSATAEPAPSATSKARGPLGSVRDAHQLQQLVEIAVNSNVTITVTIPGEKNTYTTLFSTTNAKDFRTLDDHLCLLVAPLTPPIGNIKIRLAPQVFIRFYTDLFVAEAKVNFIKILEDRSIQLSFPTELTQFPQKRHTARIDIDPKNIPENLKASIRRPSGINCTVKIHDISVGGVSFYSDDAIPPMLANTPLTFTIARPSQKDIEINASTLTILKKGDKTCYRAAFAHKGESERDVERLVRSITEKIQEKRKKLFE